MSARLAVAPIPPLRSIGATCSALVLFLSLIWTTSLAAADSDPSSEKSRRPVPDFSKVLGDYIAKVVAIGAVSSPFPGFTATDLEKTSDHIVATFTPDSGRPLQLVFEFPGRCVECVRSRLFAVRYPSGELAAGALARSIARRAVDIEIDATRAQLPPTTVGRIVAVALSTVFRLDGVGVRVRELVWQAGSSVAAATRLTDTIWQRIWSNMAVRSGWMHDAAAICMLSLLWLMTAVLVAWETAYARLQLDRRTQFALAGILLGSALLRWVISVNGPGDLHVNLLMEDYGLAPAGLLALVGTIAPTSPATVIVVAKLLGSLAAVYVSLLAFALRRDATAAVAAGILFSIQPILVRYAGDCERQSYVIFLATVALWALASYFTTRRASALALHVVASLLCLNARPEAAFLFAFSLFLIWPGHRLSRQSAVALGAQLAIGVLSIVVSNRGRHMIEHGSRIQSVPGMAMPGPGTTLWMSPEYTAVAVIALFVLAIPFIVRERSRDGWWALLCVALTTVVARGTIADGWIANTRYQTLSLLPFVLVAGVGVALLNRTVRQRWTEASARLAVGGIWFAVVLSSLLPLYRVNAATTVDHEFQFLTDVLPKLPQDATIYCTRDDESDVEMKKYHLVSALLGLANQRWVVWTGQPLPADHNAYFFIQPWCQVRPAEWPRRQQQEISAHASDDTPRAFNACRTAARCGAQVVAAAAVPARRFAMDQYTQSDVQLAMVEISRDACSSAHPLVSDGAQ